MTTTHLPSLPSHAFIPFDPLKTEKYLSDEHEYEISNWLKLENEPLPGAGSNYSNDIFFSGSQLPLPEFSHNYVSSSFNFAVPNSISSQNTQLLNNQSSHSQYNTNSPFTYQYTALPNQYSATVHFTNSPYNTNAHFAQSTFTPNNVFPQNYASFPNSSSQYSTNSNYFVQASNPAQYSNSSSPFTSSIVPTQLFQPQYSNPNPNSTNFQNIPTAQYQYVFSQYPQQAEEVVIEDNNNKKRKNISGGKTFVRRVRQTRPKVVEAKGAIQCKGRNRKKGTQCRNAALMEYIGPRPIYCAEHIELDPKSLYEKCKSSYQKDPGDNKGCKEVVLKEFGVCYKHYGDLIQEMIDNRDCDKVQTHSERINQLLSQLERDASAAKKKDGDLYQRKNKLIPKFQEMKKAVFRAMEILEVNRQKEGFSDVLTCEELNQPILLDRMALHIVQAFSDDDDQSLSSPQSESSSIDDEFEQILQS